MLVTLAAVVALAAVGASISWYLKVRRAAAEGPATHLNRLRPISRATIADYLDRVTDAPLIREALEVVVRARSHRQLVAELNEVLIDAGAALEQGAAIPRAAGRIALAAGTGLAIVSLALNLKAGSYRSLEPLACFLIGLVGALGTYGVGRGADRMADQCRDGWNALIRALSRTFDESGGQS